MNADLTHDATVEATAADHVGDVIMMLLSSLANAS